jgi:hypothetical protein
MHDKVCRFIHKKTYFISINGLAYTRQTHQTRQTPQTHQTRQTRQTHLAQVSNFRVSFISLPFYFPVLLKFISKPLYNIGDALLAN